MHDVKAKEGATTVQLFAARKGKGIVAGSKVKAVLRAAGVKDSIAKVRVFHATVSVLAWSSALRSRRCMAIAIR